MKLKTIQERLKEWIKRDDAIINTGKITGSKYIESQEYEEIMKQFCQDFMYQNGLSGEVFQCARSMESEVVEMTCNLFNCPGPYGVLTSGGTESISMAILAHKQ